MHFVEYPRTDLNGSFDGSVYQVNTSGAYLEPGETWSFFANIFPKNSIIDVQQGSNLRLYMFKALD